MASASRPSSNRSSPEAQRAAEVARVLDRAEVLPELVAIVQAYARALPLCRVCQRAEAFWCNACGAANRFCPRCDDSEHSCDVGHCDLCTAHTCLHCSQGFTYCIDHDFYPPGNRAGPAPPACCEGSESAWRCALSGCPFLVHLCRRHKAEVRTAPRAEMVLCRFHTWEFTVCRRKCGATATVTTKPPGHVVEHRHRKRRRAEDEEEDSDDVREM